jgi:hypothetical protein
MSRTTITSAGEIYTVSPDEVVPPERRFCAFVAGQALDEVTKQPLSVPVKVSVDEPGFTVKVKSDNWFVIAGITRWQLPALSTTASTLHLRLSAPGYLSKTLTATVPKTPPGKLPVILLSTDTQLHRQP